MMKVNIEKSLKNAINQAPTLDFEKLDAMPVVKMAEHDYITMQQESRKPKTFRNFSVAVSCSLLVLICFSGWFIQYRLPDSVIALDVNPSIEIVTNKQDRILSVKALNEDAESIVWDNDYKNADLSDTVNSLVASMISQGYLTTDKNTVMISVGNKNLEKAEALSLQLDEEIQESVSSQHITLRVFRQVYAKNKEASAFAEKYNISVGKMKLVQEIIDSKPELSIDVLVQMPVEDLYAISKEYAIDLHEIIKSDDGYFDSDEDNEYDQPANTDQDDDSYSQPDTDQDENDSFQPTIDQDENDSSQPTIDQDENDSSQPTLDQDNNDTQPDAEQDDDSQPETAQEENDSSRQTIDQKENEDISRDTDLTERNKSDSDSDAASDKSANE